MNSTFELSFQYFGTKTWQVFAVFLKQGEVGGFKRNFIADPFSVTQVIENKRSIEPSEG